ncbi:MAG: hypothetical protein KC503_25020 [Myxococcales bacterium]|nr:hypothetical protein [Myxococcales bacterium]
MTTRTHVALACAALSLSACPGKNIPAPASYPAQSTIKLAASARCKGGRCSCRSLDGDGAQKEEHVAAGQKRFEFRLPRSTSALWVEVEGRGVYYKPPKSVSPECFYVDLPPGKHNVTVHGEGRDPEVGLQAGLTIYEYGPKEGPHWYRSLKYSCGGLGKCSADDLKEWVRKQRALPRGVLAPCGSVQIRAVTSTGQRNDRKLDEYREATVRFALKVYKFETYRPPGHPKCRAPSKNRPATEKTPQK